MERYIPPLISFFTINNTSISVKRFKFTLVFFKAVYHANPRAEKKFAGLSIYILKHIFRKFSNTPANNNVPL